MANPQLVVWNPALRQMLTAELTLSPLSGAVSEKMVSGYGNTIRSDGYEFEPTRVTGDFVVPNIDAKPVTLDNLLVVGQRDVKSEVIRLNSYPPRDAVEEIFEKAERIALENNVDFYMVANMGLQRIPNQIFTPDSRFTATVLLYADKSVSNRIDGLVGPGLKA
jgi:hypothetical protein